MTSVYGVLVDLQRPRQDGGAPCMFDGWFDEKALALEAMRLIETRYPHVFVQLIERVE